MEIRAEYDSLLSKLIAWGENRDMAIQRLKRGLKEYKIGRLKTDLPLLTQILESDLFRVGEVNTSFLDDFHPVDILPEESMTRDAAIAAALHIHQKRTGMTAKEPKRFNLWRQRAWREQIKTSD